MGSKKQTTNTTSNTSYNNTSKLTPFDLDSVRNQFGAASDIYADRLNNPAYYEGQTYADQSADTRDALDMIAKRAREGNPLLGQAQGHLSKVLDGSYMTAENPYTQFVDNQITESVMPRIMQRWGAAGRGQGNSDVVDAATDALGQQLGQFHYQNYENRMADMNRAIGQVPGLIAADYEDYDRLGRVGAARDAYEQLGINEDMQRWSAEQDQGANALREYQGFINPLNQMFGTQNQSGTSNTNSTSTSQMKVPAWQQALGAASMIGGMAMQPWGGMQGTMMGALGNAFGGRPMGYAASNPGWGAQVNPAQIQNPWNYTGGWM